MANDSVRDIYRGDVVVNRARGDSCRSHETAIRWYFPGRDAFEKFYVEDFHRIVIGLLLKSNMFKELPCLHLSQFS